jgi:hypothetical protein
MVRSLPDPVTRDQLFAALPQLSKDSPQIGILSLAGGVFRMTEFYPLDEDLWLQTAFTLTGTSWRKLHLPPGWDPLRVSPLSQDFGKSLRSPDDSVSHDNISITRR